ncbi:hypothetical protein PLICRDRAFT_163895 [Plicaturopsis crispa FD-325 SS-3]|nr:hypothetical protein PLICRDRAFT_163895 [Plicaturopsis crispa FD-325 SS-3]
MDLTRPYKRARNSMESDGRISPALPDEGPAQPPERKKTGRKPPLSCAECRRLKLKCDRVFPCKSCTKRGCAEICPQGALTSGKGSRFILANTEQLHAKIIQMSDRIRNLEEAVKDLYAPRPPESHPLLQQDLLLIKNTVGLYGMTGMLRNGGSNNHAENRDEEEIIDPMGNMALASSSQIHYSPTNGSARSHRHLEPSPDPGDRSSGSDDQEWQTLDLSPEILKLSQGFPTPRSIAPTPDVEMRGRLRQCLPPQQLASYLYEQARENAFWQYNPHPSESFFPNLLRHVYTAPLESLSPQRLGLLFMILAIGSLVDLKQPPDSPDGERYHHLARACVCETPVMEDTNVDTVIVLFYMTWYLVVFSDKKKGIAHAWGMLGLTAKLAQSIGLHRDDVGSKVIPEEVDKRRALFWDLLHLDARLSLSLGRPPSLLLQHSDCKRPSYTPEAGYDPSESLNHYQEWKHSSYVHYLSPALELVTSPAPDYRAVIEIDKKIRDAYIPPMLQFPNPRASRYLAMQQATLASSLESTFLQLHRTFFTRALSSTSTLSRRTQYAPSIIAVYRSAVRLIDIIETLADQEPDMTLRFLSFFANAFSAAVALCLLVSRAPHLCISPMALQQLERALQLFKITKSRSQRPFQVIPILETMVDKSRAIYTQWLHNNTGSSHVRQGSQEGPGSSGTGSGSGSGTLPDPQVLGAFANAHRTLLDILHESHNRAPSFHHPCPEPLTSQCLTLAAVDHQAHADGTAARVVPYSGNFAYDISSDGSSIIPLLRTSTANANFRVPVVDTLNFDFGALTTNWKDDSWMSFL